MLASGIVQHPFAPPPIAAAARNNDQLAVQLMSGTYMIQAEFTENEMREFLRIVEEYDSNFSDHAGSYMASITHSQFSELAKEFFNAFANRSNNKQPIRAIDSSQIRISRFGEGSYDIHATDDFALLTLTAITYECSITTDEAKKTILEKIKKEFIPPCLM